MSEAREAWTPEQWREAMALPPGKTCADCNHYTRCSRLLSREGLETSCDWAPSRFRLRVT